MTTSTQRRAETTLAFHASRIVIDVGVLVVMGAMSLPFVTSDAGDRTSIDADALPALILVLPIFAMTLIPDHTRPLPRPLGWASLVLGLAAFPYAIVKFFDASVLADTLDGDIGMGARLLVFGTFVVVAGISIGLTRLAMNLPSGGTPGARPAPPVRSRATASARSEHSPPRPSGAEQEQEPQAHPVGNRPDADPPAQEEPRHRPDQTQVLPSTRPGHDEVESS